MGCSEPDNELTVLDYQINYTYVYLFYVMYSKYGYRATNCYLFISNKINVK